MLRRMALISISSQIASVAAYGLGYSQLADYCYRNVGGDTFHPNVGSYSHRSENLKIYTALTGWFL
jgi:hypothetical protein